MDALFNDPAIEPTAERIDQALGAASTAWASYGAVLQAAGVSVEWRYYRDGGWLGKATKGSRTIAWLQINQGFARASYYFAERLRSDLAGDQVLPQRIRDLIKEAKPIGQSLAVSLELRSAADVDEAEAVLGCKLSLK